MKKLKEEPSLSEEVFKKNIYMQKLLKINFNIIFIIKEKVIIS